MKRLVRENNGTPIDLSKSSKCKNTDKDLLLEELSIPSESSSGIECIPGDVVIAGNLDEKATSIYQSAKIEARPNLVRASSTCTTVKKAAKERERKLEEDKEQPINIPTESNFTSKFGGTNNNFDRQSSRSSDRDMGNLKEYKMIRHQVPFPNNSNENLYPETTVDKVSMKFKKDCQCPSVLIVDDQYINRYIIKQFCTKYGIFCSEAEDGQAAIDLIKKHSQKLCCDGFDLVLMDLNMPIMGGIEASRQILELKQNHEIHKDIKVVAVTAFPSKTEKNKCSSVGISEFIVKPFTINHFIDLITV